CPPTPSIHRLQLGLPGYLHCCYFPPLIIERSTDRASSLGVPPSLTTSHCYQCGRTMSSPWPASAGAGVWSLRGSGSPGYQAVPELLEDVGTDELLQSIDARRSNVQEPSKIGRP